MIELLLKSIELAKAKQLPAQKTAKQRELENLIRNYRSTK